MKPPANTPACYRRRSLRNSTRSTTPERYSLNQPKDTCGVAVKNLNLCLGREARGCRDGFEVGQPSIWCYKRIVATEQHFVAKAPPCLLDDDLGKILGRPSRKVHEHIGLMLNDGQHLFMPWPRWMGPDDRQLR